VTRLLDLATQRLHRRQRLELPFPRREIAEVLLPQQRGDAVLLRALLDLIQPLAQALAGLSAFAERRHDQCLR
jgi:hypothetical protein